MGEPIVEGRGGAGDPVAPPGRHESRADPEAASGAPAAPSGAARAGAARSGAEDGAEGGAGAAPAPADAPDGGPRPARSRRRWGRRRALTAAAGAVLLAAAGGALAYGLGGGTPESEASSGLPPATTEVARETISDVETASGELGFGPAATAAARAGGTLTRVPGTGAEVGRGETLFEVDNRPVTVMYGDEPAYRPMAVGTEGADVEQLERNLSKLGYGGFTVDSAFTEGTAAAVMEWQDDRGLEVTGTVELGSVLFAPGAVRVDSLQAEEGGQVQPGAPVLDYTGTEKLVTTELEPADQRLVEDGGEVEVTLPDGQTVAGAVEEVTTVIEPATEQQDAQTVIEVVVALEGDDAQEAAADYPLPTTGQVVVDGHDVGRSSCRPGRCSAAWPRRW
ncbi:peptidoglycan-binding protein [Streptomonospora nanhaiensis]|uniref:peptidoglycan-binding protein n=1 Tax=Streptomonospora nanhaiensis TaxID=1323731 RepID=UPI00360A8A52